MYSEEITKNLQGFKAQIEEAYKKGGVSQNQIDQISEFIWNNWTKEWAVKKAQYPTAESYITEKLAQKRALEKEIENIAYEAYKEAGN